MIHRDMADPSQLSTVVDVVRARARQLPEKRAYTFLRDGESEEASLTYAECDLTARRIAAALSEARLGGRRALLLFPPGLDFIRAFFGCLYSGVVAVPAYPPSNLRSLPRLRSIAADARPSAVLTTSSLAAKLRRLTAGLDELGEARWISVDDVESDAGAWQAPEIDGDSIAFLQYTSGSTSAPKGVMVSHGNLLHNEELIRASFGVREDSVIAGWLPLYHDMGLIGTVLQPLYGGASCVLMAPVAFLSKPQRWLEVVTRYRATISGGPNFAYDLCVRRISEEDRAGLDLSSWEVAFNGAEPVRSATLEAFSAAFAAQGFRPQGFFPCYGLAESTLFVTGGDPEVVPRSTRFDPAALEDHRGVVREEGRALVSCGRAPASQSLLIVDPQTRRPVAENGVGEIWVAGPSVAKGYWDRPESTAETFEARLADDPAAGVFLRTGDLGLLHEGELYVTGRLKDMIILRGRNLYPQDIELAAELSHPALRPGCGAAVSVEVDGEEQLVLIWELVRHGSHDVDAIVAAVRQAVAEEFEARVYELVLLRTGGIPKTSSGKIQRHAARRAYLTGDLPEVGRSGVLEIEATADELAASGLELDRDALLALAPEERPGVLSKALRQRVANLVGTKPDSLATDAPLTALGLDSLRAVELKQSLDDTLRLDLPLADLLAGPSTAELTGLLLEELTGGPERDHFALFAEATPLDGSSALSVGQQALYFLQRLAPTSGGYHIFAAAEVEPEIDREAWGRAWAALAERHEILRTVFVEEGDMPRRRVLEEPALDLRFEEAPGLDDEDAVARLTDAAYEPFDLARGPLTRTLVLRRPGKRDLLFFATHHIITDFWSLTLLSRELSVLYARETGHRAALLPEIERSYGDYVRWQRHWLESARGRAEREYWRQNLRTPLPVLELPTDRPRPSRRTWSGGLVRRTLEPSLKASLERLSREHRGTLFMTLLAGYQLLLHRYSGQRDVLVGSPTAGRSHPELRSLVGYLMNPVVLRTSFQRTQSFSALLRQVRDTALGAFAHQDYPFPLLAEELQPRRDARISPVFQALFMMQRPPLGAPGALSAFAMGETGGRLELGPLQLESVELEERGCQFDLTLRMAPEDVGAEGSLWSSLQYDSDLFDASTAERMLEHLHRLFAHAVAAPTSDLSELSMLGEAETRQLLSGWNDPSLETVPDACVHQLFEAQVAREPERVAAVFDSARAGEQTLSYGALNRRANRLAHALVGRSVGPEVLVGLMVERGPEMMIGLLAVLKAGGAYLPLDPTYPEERLELMVQDSGVSLILSQRSLRSRLPEAGRGLEVLHLDALPAEVLGGPEHDPEPSARPENRIYTIYTSGSTGRPKGVEVQHHAFVNLLCSMSREPGLGRADVMLSVTTLSFDVAGPDLHMPLMHGARMVVVSRDTAADAGALARRIARHRPTRMQATPTTWQMLLNSGWVGAPQLQVLSGGELLPLELARGLTARVAGLWNLYGPTEATVWSAVQRVEVGPTSRGVPVGLPIAHSSNHLLDRHLHLVPVGVLGEIYIGGVAVARGYLGRPALTAERFLPDPFSRRPGGRLYRTGDLARRGSAGSLEVLGRLDHQVKILGFRIELGEIETVLARHPGVGETVVVARGETAGDQQLVAYVVPRAGTGPEPAELRKHVARSLPDYMVPAFVMVLDEMPRTPNEKIDRKALPAPALQRDTAPEAPRNATEEILAGIWCELLGQTEISVHDDFFELGGHSLKATQLMSRVRSLLNVDLPLSVLFESPTLAGLAEHVATARREPNSEIPLTRVTGEDRALLSFAQQRLWFLDQLEPGSPLYNIVNGSRLLGPVCLGSLERGLNEVIRRHEALRTTFAETAGVARQEIAESLVLTLGRVDLTGLPEPLARREAERLARGEARRPFALDRGPLIRGTVIRFDEEDHLMLIALHHIVSDGWSMGVLLREVQQVYGALRRGEPVDGVLPPLAVQYADYADWQRRWMASEGFERQLAYWKERLQGVPVLDLPLDRPRPPVETFVGTKRHAGFEPGLAEQLVDFSRRQGVTPYMTLMAVFQFLLHRLTGQGDLVTGTPIANRNRPETEALIGFFANTLVMRARVRKGERFVDLLRQVRTTALDAYAHQDLPFETLVDELQPERDLSRNPIFQVMMVLQNAPLPEMDLSGARLIPKDVDSGTAKFDLTLFLWQEEADDRNLTGILEYSTELFDSTTMQRFLRGFRVLLDAVITDPSRRLVDYDLLPEAARHQLQVEWNDSERPTAEASAIHHLVARHAASNPSGLALIDDGKELSFGEIDRRANQLAHLLREHGVGPEVPVGICVDRSWFMVVGLLAALKAGGAGVALDPTYPDDRLTYIIQDARLPVLITQDTLRDSLPDAGATKICLDGDGPLVESRPTEPPEVEVSPDNPMYLIYTSGSTGIPKGIVVTHRAFMNLMHWQLGDSTLASSARTLQYSTFGFCVSFQEIFSSLCSGGALVLPPESVRRDVEGLWRFLDAAGIERLHMPFAALNQMADISAEHNLVPRALREVITAGEQLQVGSSIRQLFERLDDCTLHNQYGASETHVITSYALRGVPAAWPHIGPVGRPVANTRIHLLDADLSPVPVAVAGEVLAAGPAVPRGYLSDPAMTASKVIPDPFSTVPGARLYKTGDLARYLANGQIEYFGRIDTQVKVRGFRVELGEIETVLKLHEGVRDAAVVAHPAPGTGHRLVGYVIYRDPEDPAHDSLQRFLKEKLPEYMVPWLLVPMDSFPLNANGKLDRAALPAPESLHLERPDAYVAPRTAVEELMAQIWAQVLEVDRVGVHDNFFQIGGHSLLATQLVSRVRATFQVQLPLRSLFEANTVEELARIVIENEPRPGQSEKIATLLQKVKKMSSDDVKRRLAARRMSRA